VAALEVVAKEGVVADTTRATTASAIAHLVHPVITPDRLGLSERRLAGRSCRSAHSRERRYRVNLL